MPRFPGDPFEPKNARGVKAMMDHCVMALEGNPTFASDLAEILTEVSGLAGTDEIDQIPQVLATSEDVIRAMIDLAMLGYLVASQESGIRRIAEGN